MRRTWPYRESSQGTGWEEPSSARKGRTSAGRSPVDLANRAGRVPGAHSGGDICYHARNGSRAAPSRHFRADSNCSLKATGAEGATEAAGEEAGEGGHSLAAGDTGLAARARAVLVEKLEDWHVGDLLVKKAEDREVGELLVQKTEDREVGELLVEKLEVRKVDDLPGARKCDRDMAGEHDGPAAVPAGPAGSNWVGNMRAGKEARRHRVREWGRGPGAAGAAAAWAAGAHIRHGGHTAAPRRGAERDTGHRIPAGGAAATAAAVGVVADTEAASSLAVGREGSDALEVRRRAEVHIL